MTLSLVSISPWNTKGLGIYTLRSSQLINLQRRTHNRSNNSRKPNTHPPRRARKLRHNTGSRRRGISHHGTIPHHLKIRTSNPRRVPRMQHKRQPTEERRTPRHRTEIAIHETRGEVTSGHDLAAVLAGQIADLACRGVSCVAHVQFANVLRVEVAHGRGAVAVAGDGHCMDVPCEGAVHGLRGEVAEVHAELHAGHGAYGFYGALDGRTDERVEHGGWERGDIGGGGLVGLGWRGTVDAAVGWIGRERGDDGTLEGVDACEGDCGSSGR